MTQLKQKLRSTLEMVAQTAEGQPGITYYLEMLGRTHQRLQIERRHFDMWQAALLDTVAAFDEAYSDRVGAAWSQVIGSVIESVFAALHQTHKLAS
jgi:hemoglobin-like flavoprotein